MSVVTVINLIGSPVSAGTVSSVAASSDVESESPPPQLVASKPKIARLAKTFPVFLFINSPMFVVNYSLLSLSFLTLLGNLKGCPNLLIGSISTGKPYRLRSSEIANSAALAPQRPWAPAPGGVEAEHK